MKFLKLICFLLANFSAGAFAAAPATHGMLLFGEQAQYVSHLPMFHAPHDYQAIARVKLADAAPYLNERKLLPGTEIFTIVPEPFSLPEGFHQGATIPVAVYRGHFERGGKELYQTEATIEEIVVLQKLDAHQAKAQQFEAIVFGSKTEAFLAHRIGAAPSFDQILQIQAQGDLAVLTTAASVKIQTNPNQELATGCFVARADNKWMRVQVLRSLYLEKDELSH